MSEVSRLEALKQYLILDSSPETAYDDITRAVAERLQVPIALINILDADRDWFKSRVGIELTESPRSTSFCVHLLDRPDAVLVVPDLREDERFRDHPLVTGEPFVRFYAGAAIVSTDGHVIGTVCAYDFKPRVIDDDALKLLASMAAEVMNLLESRRLKGMPSDARLAR